MLKIIVKGIMYSLIIMLLVSTYMNIVLTQKLQRGIDNFTAFNRNQIENHYTGNSYDLGFEHGIETFASTVTADCWYSDKTPAEAKKLCDERIKNIPINNIINFRFKDGWLDVYIKP